MKYCKNCKVKVDTDRNYCPLCFRELQDDGQPQSGEYPFLARTKNEHFTKNNTFILKLFIFISICAVAICGLVDWWVNKDFGWSMLVLASILYIWILINHTILSRRGVFEKIIIQLLGLMFILYVCQKLSFKRDWLASYVFPSISIATLSTLLMITFIRRDKSWVLSFVAVIILLTGVSVFFFLRLDKFYILNIINLTLCALSLLGYFTFGYSFIKTEFFKKFHL